MLRGFFGGAWRGGSWAEMGEGKEIRWKEVEKIEVRELM